MEATYYSLNELIEKLFVEPKTSECPYEFMVFDMRQILISSWLRPDPSPNIWPLARRPVRFRNIISRREEKKMIHVIFTNLCILIEGENNTHIVQDK